MPSIVWKGQLTFGLVSILVKLYRAAQKERVSLQSVYCPKSWGRRPDRPVAN
jgi:non-homologous end joining protein Ku